MKKLNYLILGLAGLTMASCSQDDLLNGVADGNFQVTINLPTDVATRAIGDDALAAQQLNYAIFDENGEYVSQGTASFGGNTSMTLPLSLASGASFKIAFFAQSPNSTDVYKFNASQTAHSVTVDYGAMNSALNNADGYDCFYNVLETGVIGSSTMNTQVTLNRIVAQINWGTSDYDQATVTNTYGTNLADLTSTLTVTVPNEFDLLTGETAGDPEEVEIGIFAPNNVAEAEKFPVTGYQYVAMQYVLVPADKGLYNLDLAVSNAAGTAENPIKVANAPIQANYRTNIYGNLLTDNIQFKVDLSADWGTPDYNISLVWDGETSTTPEIDTQEKTIAVNAASDLAGLADIISGKTQIAGVPTDLEGYTVTLAANYDLDGNPLSLGSATRSSGDTGDDTQAFRGTFDGNGKTISGLKIEYTGNDGNAVAAFIPNLDNTGELKNVTFDNVTINGGAAEQASIVGLITNGAKVSGVTVSSGSITATEGAAGIVGRILSEGTVEDCINYADITVSAKNGGGIVGAAYYGNKGMTISNCKNYGKVVATAKVESIGGIVATCSADVIGCTNYGPVGDSTIAAPAGGIVGYQVSSGKIENCTNEGTITGAAEVAGIVAFIGNVTYAGYISDIYLTGNTNNGILISSGTVGGILGINRNGCYMQDNTNNAPSITGSTVAGIVGNAMKSGSQADGYVHLVSGNVNKTPLDKMTGTKVQDIFTGTLYVGSVLTTN